MGPKQYKYAENSEVEPSFDVFKITLRFIPVTKPDFKECFISLNYLESITSYLSISRLKTRESALFR